MIILGYFLSTIMGIILGSIGAGGSILILPILVYFIGISPTHATSYSLIIVGFTALIGSLTYFKNKNVNIYVAVIFSIPSILAIYLTRRYFMPVLPEQISIFNYIVTKDLFIMFFLVLLMIMASVLMISSKPIKKNNDIYKDIDKNIFRIVLIIIEGIAIGFFTGIIGAGGGFLIIPALVIFLGLDMKMAVGTSLVIIFIKSLFGFIGDYQSGFVINYYILFTILVFTMIGIVFGSNFSKYLKVNVLKKCFGWFTLGVAILILLKESFV